MDPNDIAALEECKDYVCDNLQSLPKILGYLRNKGVFDKHIESTLNMKQLDKKTRHNALVAYLMNSQEDALSLFIEALKSDRQSQIAKRLESSREKHSLDESGTPRNAAQNQGDAPMFKNKYGKAAPIPVTTSNQTPQLPETPKPIEIDVTKILNKASISSILSKEHETYKFQPNEKKAKILIINNISFEKEEHKDTDKDKESIKLLCKNVLKIDDVENCFHENLKAKDMENSLKEFASKFKEQKAGDDVQAVFIFILSHGSDDDVITGTDGKPVSLVDVAGLFTPAKCPGLATKPKVLFIQAGRGDKLNLPIRIASEPANKGGKFSEISQMDDFIIAFSSGQTTDGSLFLQVLAHVLALEWSKGKIIEQILKKVQIGLRQLDIFIQREANPQGKQEEMEVTHCSGYYSHLLKDLILVPK